MSAGLGPFRQRLDDLDGQIVALFGERFEICRQVAAHKRGHGIPMMQSARVEQVRAKYLEHGFHAGLPTEFAAALFELTIAATCKLEDELIARPPDAEPA
jgi:4-amino-4-deoxychorismate mutase